MRYYILSLLLTIVVSSFSQKQTPYKTPNKAIVDLVNAPSTPNISISPDGNWMLQLGQPVFSSIDELSQPELRLAGLRINPRTNGPSRARFYDTLSLSDLNSGKEFSVEGLPTNPKILNLVWSPDNSKVAFTHTEESGIELWVLDVSKQKVKRISDAVVNDAMVANPIQWADNGEWIVFTAISNERGSVPAAGSVPKGPIVRESKGKQAAARTYQDLLKDAHDVALFRYYTMAQLTKVNLKGELYAIGMPAQFKSFSFSPNKEYVLVKMIHQPFSYLVPYYRFPFKVEIWQSEGALWREMFNISLAENIPTGIGAVRKGPRNIQWRNDKPNSIFWVLAMDGGDPNRIAEVRDHLYLFEPPFDGDGMRSIPFKYRFDKIVWGKEDYAIAHEWWWDTRTEQVSGFNPTEENGKKQVLFSFNWQDEYAHPGEFMTISGEQGEPVLFFTDKENDLLLSGKGASSEGYKPFVDQYNIKEGKTTRLWRSNNPYYEYPIHLTQGDKKIVLTRRESKTDVPNYFVRNLNNGVVKQITNFENPYPQLATVKQQLVQYTREDGIALSGKLYLPPGYSVGDSLLPVLMWAYPQEHKSAATAGQLKESPNRFIRIGWWSPLFWVLRGYAVFDNAAMPIVGEGDKEPNDTFTEQLVANAKAAITVLDSMGIADRHRVAIGGHSYGAFMAANLLAHSDLFAAGIARSGAYNRTLTPFGFQAEERTFWEARNTYVEMSPFSYAHQVNEPLLLIHGSADNNSGTFPLQSERFYTALKGNGAKTRLVILPNESHGYRAKESIYHMLWEMDRWLYIHVKNKK